MTEFIAASAFFGVLMSLGLYQLGAFLKKKLKSALVNPLLIAIAGTIICLLALKVDYADYAAAALAKDLKVRKFVLVSDVPGVLRDQDDPQTLFSTLHLGDVETLRADGTISGGMLPKIESCCDAIRAGVRKVHLVDGRMAHSLLLEIFTREGVGTEITE